jgi:hypothetical protein
MDHKIGWSSCGTAAHPTTRIGTKSWNHKIGVEQLWLSNTPCGKIRYYKSWNNKIGWNSSGTAAHPAAKTGTKSWNYKIGWNSSNTAAHPAAKIGTKPQNRD